MATIANLSVSLTARTSQFARGMRGARRELHSFRTTVSGIGRAMGRWGVRIGLAATAGAAAFGYMANRVTQEGDRIAKMARALGMTASELDAWGFAAERSGANMEMVTKSFAVFARTMSYAKDDLTTYTREFDKLGVGVLDQEGNLKDLSGMVLETADALSVMQNKTKALGIGKALFGKGGLELMPMLLEGREGIKALMAEGVRMGLWTDEQARDAERMQDALTGMHKVWKSFVRDAVMTFVPMMTASLKSMADWLATNRDRVKRFFDEIGGKTREVVADMLDWIIRLDESKALDTWFRKIRVGWAGVILAGRTAYFLLKATISGVKALIFEYGDWLEAQSSKRGAAVAKSEEKIWKSLLTKTPNQVAAWRKAMEKELTPQRRGLAKLQPMRHVLEEIEQWEQWRTEGLKSGRMPTGSRNRWKAFYELAQDRAGMASRAAEGFESTFKRIEKQLTNVADMRDALGDISTAWTDALDTAFAYDPSKAEANTLGALGEMLKRLRDKLRDGRKELEEEMGGAAGAGVDQMLGAMGGGRRFAPAAVEGSVEAYRMVIQDSARRPRSEEAISETAKNTARTAENTERMTYYFSNQPFSPGLAEADIDG